MKDAVGDSRFVNKHPYGSVYSRTTYSGGGPRRMKHSPVLPQSHDGETLRNVHSIWMAVLNGLHLLIVALNN